MIALIASFFSLFVGPLVYQTFGPMRRTDKIVHGIVLVVVGATILFDIVPEAYQNIGIMAIIFCLFGFAGPTLIEHGFRRAADTTHKLTILLGITGLLSHAFIDGVAIQTGQHSGHNGLTLAIILHRLPVGLTIWWLLKPLLGERYALVTLFLMGLATVGGYWFDQALIDFTDSYFVFAMQAFISGSLLHVVIHKPHSDGCMHTSEIHHEHAHHSHVQKLSAKLFKWETLGFLVGSLIFLAVHYYTN